MGRRVPKGNTISDWLNETPLSSEIDTEAPLSSGGFDVSDRKDSRCKMKKGWIGYLLNDANTVQRSNKYVSFYSLGYIGANGRDVTRGNFEKAAMTFSIRRSTYEYLKQKKRLWIQDKDLFTKPSTGLLTNEFTANCVVYSLFDSQSNQTSLRNYEYNGNTYRVENEFFPFSIDFVNQLAVKHNNLDIQADLQGDDERFVYKWLQDHEEHLSAEASELINLAEQLYTETFPYRDEYAKLQPRFQTNSWDAGYAQIARLAFGNDRINDEFLELKVQFYDARARLGEKIAQAAIEDGII